MTDDFTNPRQWRFPDISIEPHGYLLVWTDGDQAQGPLHTNFRLERNGEQLGMFETDLLGNAPIDTFSFSPQFADTSYGRFPDASDQLQHSYERPFETRGEWKKYLKDNGIIAAG